MELKCTLETERGNRKEVNEMASLHLSRAEKFVLRDVVNDIVLHQILDALAALQGSSAKQYQMMLIKTIKCETLMSQATKLINFRSHKSFFI